MSDNAHAHIPEAEKFDANKLGGTPSLLLIAGVVGLGLTAIGAFISKEMFAYTYLFAFTVFFTLIVGATFWNCLHHATDSEWSVVVRRQMENLGSLFPYLFLFFIPVLLCRSTLWKWWTMADGVDILLDEKRPYLSHWFFLLRVALYFGIISWVALSLRKHSVQQDTDGKGAHTISMRRFGVGGIPAVGLGITFAGFDWLMGLDFHWFSTMWGVYLFAGAAGSSMALLAMLSIGLQRAGYLKVVNDEHYHIMGKLMLAFTIFWAYIGFSQYMLIWYANIPEENIYFVIRNQGNWVILSTALVTIRFFILLPILLTQWVKKNQNYLWWAAITMIAMQVLDVFIIVIPALRKTGCGFFDVIYALCPLIGIGGILAWLFLQKLSSSYLFPTRDPRLVRSLNLHN
jgi:hypothetical protein